MNVKIRLRNVKCVFVVHNSLAVLRNRFSLHKKNYTLRLRDKVTLTLYPNNLFRIHATGISALSDFQCILTFFELNNINVSSIDVNNTFWLLKPLVIKNFYSFATFCNGIQKSSPISIDASNIGLNGDLVNAMFLRHLGYDGTVIIHRTCTLILGSKNVNDVKSLLCDLKTIIDFYESSLNSN